MNYAPYFNFYVFLLLISSSPWFIACNSGNEEPKPTLLQPDQVDKEPATNEDYPFASASHDSLIPHWIVGAWTDKLSVQPAFLFDSTHIRYPDSEERYPYRIDSSQLGLYFEEDDFWLYGEVDMPNDSTLILIFSDEMAVFYKEDKP